MALKLDERRVAELSNFWSTELARNPSKNQNELWKEHLLIRQVLGVVDGEVYNFRENFNRPAREECTPSLMKWLEEEGVNIGSVAIRPTEFGYGLFAMREIATDDTILRIPRKVFLSVDCAADYPEIRRMQANDYLLTGMPNITLAMIVGYMVLTENPRFTPYINSLPDSNLTAFFFSEKQILSLKPSPIFEATLLMFRSIARHYIYFVLRIYGDAVVKTKTPSQTEYKFHKSPFNSEKFTFDFYRWCVSVVTTRQNVIPSTEYKSSDGFTFPIPALIPLIDFANYQIDKKDSAGMIYDTESMSVLMHVRKPIAIGEEIFLDYGRRSNGNFLEHNGFVPLDDNDKDMYEIKFGFPKTPKTFEKQKRLMERIVESENGGYEFTLHREGLEELDIKRTALWYFASIFVATDLDQINSAENKARTREFLLQRIQLLQRPYSTLAEKEDETADLISRYIWRLKNSELKLLRMYENKISALEL
ncbi:Protein-histidine N-methyltransferase [Aphelenchoides besseyi]|nr:Protein-histidine N-methyltransferase [Aphelenchoides besseyi]KAI6210611.1 Protein-histidine N-methyltransferase [Aphelenchoides besseyi]